MRRKEKNDMLKAIGETLDEVILVHGDAMPVTRVVILINQLKALDEGMYIDHGKRKYHEAIKSGKICLEAVVSR